MLEAYGDDMFSNAKRMLWRQTRNFLLDLLFPKICASCKKETDYLCEDCFLQIEPCIKQQNIRGLSVLSCFIYEEKKPIAKLIHSWKYDFVTDAESVLQKVLKKALEQISAGDFFQNCILCPVPLHQKRFLWRGFEQTEHLTKLISYILREDFGIETRFETLLQKNIDTKAQGDLSRQERLQNTVGAFGIKKNMLHRENTMKHPKTIIIVDDVVTTGTTLRECAKVLRKHFPNTDIKAFVIARAE